MSPDSEPPLTRGLAVNPVDETNALIEARTVRRLSRELVAVGLIIVVVAALLTVVSCGLEPNSVRRSTALFLEALCPAQRMEGWAPIPAWHMLFSGLLWLWVLGLGSILAGLSLWLRGR